ncbi:MAG: hypothetical protein M3439_00445 [Chloroflexota bacterium]|nr:hypothetical protein [Chloroflexota bacterium]
MAHPIEIGRICRLQIQTNGLKVGPAGGRYYDPAPLREVPWLDLDIDGVMAIVDDMPTIDVHNVIHPATKNRSGINAVSVGFTSHYRQVRQQYGDHLVDGIAGENILVETDRMVTLDQITNGLLILGDDGRQIELRDISVAHPCVEFGRFALGDRAVPALAVSDALRVLDGGLRGYYAAVVSLQPLRVKRGDRVFAIRDE